MGIALNHYLRQFGIKPSVQRLAVMEYLLSHRKHPTAEEIYQALSAQIPTLSKTTVYNTLKLFADHQAVLVLDLDQSQLHYDGDITPHAHFFCRECQTIIDLPLAESSALQQLLPEGLEADDIQLYYKGRCGACKKASSLKTS